MGQCSNSIAKQKEKSQQKKWPEIGAEADFTGFGRNGRPISEDFTGNSLSFYRMLLSLPDGECYDEKAGKDSRKTDSYPNANREGETI